MPVPAVELAVAAGLEIGESGGIAVSNTMVTSDVNIYALGDLVAMFDHDLGHKTLVQLAGPAHKQASVVAANLLGDHKHIRAFQSTTIAKVFDLSVAITGASEKQLKAAKVSHSKSYIDAPNHATYYPNAYPITIKLLFNPDGGEVLSAQVVPDLRDTRTSCSSSFGYFSLGQARKMYFALESENRL